MPGPHRAFAFNSATGNAKSKANALFLKTLRDFRGRGGVPQTKVVPPSAEALSKNNLPSVASPA